MSDHADPTATSSSVLALAEELRTSFLHKPFGIIKFWGFGLVRPNDQSFELVSIHADGDRLDLTFVHESRTGLAGVISLWKPEGLEPAPEGIGQGLAIRSAARLKMDENEAALEGDQFRIKTSRGEGVWPIQDRPALVLAQ